MFLLIADLCAAADLTGNWVVRVPNADGTERRTYFNLKQEGSQITGGIRANQFYYKIAESTGDAGGFTLTGRMLDGKSPRQVRYEGKLVGDEL
ncbi:MAG: glycoside hydrolase family 27 protein, partial [Acidobacteriota bacterium]|nr:glycoside hydrolase family 27 protein [Acidobacteriota bacterium]